VEEAETLGQSSGEPKTAVGVDLGITRLATLSDGRYLENPKPLERSLDRVRCFKGHFQEKGFFRITG